MYSVKQDEAQSLWKNCCKDNDVQMMCRDLGWKDLIRSTVWGHDQVWIVQLLIKALKENDFALGQRNTEFYACFAFQNRPSQLCSFFGNLYR